MNEHEDVRSALENLALEHEELREMASRLGGFNVFEAMGQVRRELRHSDFLGYLLDPSASHGFGGEFLRLLVGALIKTTAEGNLRSLLLKALIGELDHVQVSRETMNVDILCVDHQNKFVIVIENKVFSGEHSDQLTRYKKVVAQRYPEFAQILIFLTPDGSNASDDQYLALSYTSITDLISRLRRSAGDQIDPHLDRTLTDYQLAVRRHITMSDPELEDLARKIYSQHKQALDFIFERRPDLISNIGDALADCLAYWEDALPVLHRTKTQIVFAPSRWLNSPFLSPHQNDETYGTVPRPFMNFQLIVGDRRTKLSLVVDQAPNDVRDKILDYADQMDATLLPNRTKTPGQKSTTIMYLEILGPEDLENGDDETLPKLASDRLNSHIVSGGLDALENAFIQLS